MIVISPRRGGSAVFKLDYFDNLLVCHELYQPAVVRVGMCGRLAGCRRRAVRERDSERTTFAGVEHMHVTGHAGRHYPPRNRARIENRAINDRAGRVNVLTDASRAHARTLTCAVRRATADRVVECGTRVNPLAVEKPLGVLRPGSGRTGWVSE